jgi:serine/threonine protein kinase
MSHTDDNSTNNTPVSGRPEGLSTGQRIAHYEITEQIGAGGMGEVYRAKDTKLERHVAIKVLPLSFMQDSARRSRFEQEARALAALNHPNIAAIYGLRETRPRKSSALFLAVSPTGLFCRRVSARTFADYYAALWRKIRNVVCSISLMRVSSLTT